MRRDSAVPAARDASGRGVVRALPFDGDEAALVDALKRGRPDAGAAFYDRYASGIHGLVFRLLGADPEHEDVVNDVFVRALESLERLRDPAALQSWLFGIAVRAVLIRLQRRKRQRWLRFVAPEEVPQPVTLPNTEVGEALRDVYAILDGIAAEERIALVLHRVEGLSLEEAAHAAGTSLATFRRRLARGEQKFFARAKSRPTLEGWLREGNGR